MSVTVNCFEGLKIENCTLPTLCCCRKHGTAAVPATVTNGVFFFGADEADEPYHVCVVQATNRALTTLGPGENEDVTDWDTMLVDVKHCIVSLDGKRWPHLMQPVDKDPRGHDLSILRPIFRNICEPLVKLALTGVSKQMDTICNNQNMTMYACPVYYDKHIVGVQLTYRPTTYTEDDVLRIITEH